MKLGRKAESLIKLRQAGFNIPSFVVLRQDECTTNNIEKIIKKEFAGVNLFVVRSSYVGEDEEGKSFAGYFYSGIGISQENIVRECKKVIASYNGGSGGIILQEFICSTVAGVLFSNAGDNKMIINSNFGLCESVVKGQSCDEYVINRVDKNIISTKISLQKEAVYYRNNKFEHDRHSERSLSDSQIKDIIEKAILIENFFKAPQDIEFCFYDERLYILQSRPITRSIFVENEIIFYDSANIAESYSGATLPLTLSFVKIIYSEVYKNLLCASGISRKKVEKNKNIFNSLTASFHGKLYYNMNSWYQMMSFFPGYKRNKNNLELMISSNINDEIRREIKPGKIFSVYYYLLVILKLLGFPFTAFYFKRRIKKILNKYSQLQIEKMSFNECRDLFQDFLSAPLKRWHVAVENDTGLMTLLGKIYAKDEKAFNAIKITSHTVSANQVRELKNLSDLLMSDKNIADALTNKNKNKFNDYLLANKQVKDSYDKYFNIYGGRFANELKLESDDLREDFQKFSSLVEIYSKTELANKIIHNTFVRGGLLVFLIRFFATNREEMRLLRSNFFSMVRKVFVRVGVIFYEQGYIKEAKDVFYLSIDEIFNNQIVSGDKFVELIAKRKAEYHEYNKLTLPSHFSLRHGESPVIKTEAYQNNNKKILLGSSGSPGSVSGRIRVFDEFYIPDIIDFDILVTSHTDPGWVPIIGLSKGIIVEYGGVLSHASIVSRELGIPAVIGVKDATKILKTGDFVELNGSLGSITIREDR
jgi:rifampicin phosphotransferase